MRILLTVNPRLITGARFQTVRSIVTALDQVAELIIVPIDGIDFRRGRVRAYRRIGGGRFESIGVMVPRADVWINYSDGFYLDPASLGFATPGAFLEAQHQLYGEACASGRVTRLINTVNAEQATLKLWLSKLDPARDGVIASHRLMPASKAATLHRIEQLRARYGELVIKPNWGGASQGVIRIESAHAARAYADRYAAKSKSIHPLDAWCVQPLVNGPEKRLWFAGDRCIDGRILIERPRPWDPYEARSKRIERYYFADLARAGTGVATRRTRSELKVQFRADLAIACAIWRRAGLEVGSVDFIGDRVNELNGCGTTYTQYNGWRCVTDARAQLVTWLLGVVRASRR